MPATITVLWNSGGGKLDHSETVPVSGLISTSLITVCLASIPDVDDNDVEELESVTLSASFASAGFARIDASFKAPVTGPINLNLMVM